MNRKAFRFAVACLTLASACTIYAAAQKTSPPAQKSGATINNPAIVASGAKIYSKQCAVCHYATTKEKKIGPGLANIYTVGKYTNGKKVDDASMRAWIEAGGKDMPGFKESLKPNEIRDLLAYLRTL